MSNSLSTKLVFTAMAMCVLVLVSTHVMAQSCSTCGNAASTTYVAPAPMSYNGCGVPGCAPCANTCAPCATAAASTCPPPRFVRCGDIIEQLAWEQRQIQANMDIMANAPVCQLGGLYGQLRSDLVAHINSEQTVFYPALEQSCCRPYALRGEADSAVITTLLCQLDQIPMNSDAWIATFDTLKDTVQQHQAMESRRIFGAARNCLTPAQICAMCADYNGQRQVALAGLCQSGVITTGLSCCGAKSVSENTGFSNMSFAPGSYLWMLHQSMNAAMTPSASSSTPTSMDSSTSK